MASLGMILAVIDRTSRRAKSEIDARDRHIVLGYAGGLTLKQLAGAAGLSTEEVRSILEAWEAAEPCEEDVRRERAYFTDYHDVGNGDH